MRLLSTRPGRAFVALAVVALNACVDTSNPTEVRAPRSPNLAVGDVLLVTNTSGASVAGSIRQALNQATGGEIIRFDPAWRERRSFSIPPSKYRRT